jgi:hypothetical protein
MPRYVVYAYEPSFTIALAGAGALIVSMTISGIQLFRYKTPFFALIVQAQMAQTAAALAHVFYLINPQPNPMKDGAVMAQSILFSMIPSLLGIGIFFVFTRLVWFVTPNEKRNKHVIGMPVHHLSFLWGLAFVVPDMVKGVMGFAFKPQPGQPMDSHSFPVRIEEICMVIQVFVWLLYTIWTIRFMRMSSHWLIPGEAEAKDWRRLGWTTVAASAVMTVCCRVPLRYCASIC